MSRKMVLRPNADVAQTGGWVHTGFTTYYQCVNDDGVDINGDVTSPLDTTRCEETSQLNQYLRLAYDDPSFPAGNLLITSVQPKLRAAQSSATPLNSVRVRLGMLSTVDAPDDLQLTSTTFVNKAGRARPRNPQGGLWQPSNVVGIFTDVWCNFALGIYVSSMALLINYTMAGSISAITPTGTISTTRPEIGWAWTQEDGYQADRFQVKVFTATQVFTPGFSVDTSIPVYDSGEELSSATSWQLDADLPSADVYVVYVRGGFTLAGTVLYSTWSNAAFTVTLDPPAAPVITTFSEPDSGRNVITLQGADNLLNQQDSDFEDPSRGIGGWVNFPTPASLAQDSTQASKGTYSLKVTGTGSGDAFITGPLGNVVIIPNKPVTAIAYLRANTTPRTIQIQFNWSDKNNTSYTATVSAGTSDVVGSWTKISATATPPVGADRLRISIIIRSITTSEIHWIDQVAIVPGTSTDWTRGGFANKNLMEHISSTLDGSMGVWTSDGSASLASLGGTAKSGAGSLQLTQNASTANNYMLAKVNPAYQVIPVNPDILYTVSAWCYGTSGRRFYVGLYSIDANNNIIQGSNKSAFDGSSPPVQTFTATNNWQKAWFTNYQPHPDAVGVIPYVVFNDTPTSGTGLVDEIMVSTDDYEALNPTQDSFISGDLLITKTPLVEYSDDNGVTWQTLRNGNSFRLDAQQQATLFDYEALPGVTRQYRGSTAIVDSNGVNYKSTYSPSAYANLSSDVFWLKSISDPSKNIGGFVVASVEVDLTDDVGVFKPLGRSTAITVEDIPGGEDGKMEITAIGRDTWEALKALVKSGDVLMFVSPFGEGKYIKLTGSQTWDSMTTVDSEVHKMSLSFVEVGRPV